MARAARHHTLPPSFISPRDNVNELRCYHVAVKITAQRLRELLDYDPVTGVFTWRVHRRKTPPGTVAGHVLKNGYNQIRVDNKLYLAHRLAWLHVHGVWPAGRLDHKRGNSSNAINNLREATPVQNAQNRTKQVNNTTGYKGVCYYKAGRKFIAFITIDKKRIHIGYFATALEASVAYEAAAAKHFGQFYRK